MSVDMSGTSKAALILVVIIAVAITVGWLVDIRLAIAVTVALCVVVYLLRPAFMPPGYGANAVRMASVAGILLLAATQTYWGQLLDTLVAALASQYPLLQKLPSGGPSALALIVVAVVIIGVNYLMRDTSTAGAHPQAMPSEIERKRLQSFCSALLQNMTNIDREANWSPEYFAELEAEVEIVSSGGRIGTKRIANLQKAIRKDRKSQAFLLLGDPGAGKSVALRKLARDMLAEVPDSGRIPVYINLREWTRRESPWTPEKKPSLEEFHQFLRENLKDRGDRFLQDFIDKHFDALIDQGRFFFILDGFDEIPELLDQGEDSWLIESLSNLFSRFLTVNPSVRGILSSRPFRRPTRSFAARKVLDIRPMSEMRIEQGLQRFDLPPAVRTALFTQRPDLLSTARNPLMMALLGEWILRNRNLPDSQAQLYDDYLRNSIAACKSQLAKLGKSADEVMKTTVDIAWFIYSSPAYGLEAPLTALHGHLGGDNCAGITDLLRRARIARVSRPEEGTFAFVHRRFLEYLVTRHYLDTSEDPPFEDVPTDSRGRDMMVLYAQICELSRATGIAASAWREVTTHLDKADSQLRAVHCLRFLADAFSSRPEPVVGIQPELAEIIRGRLRHGSDALIAKICLEATALLRTSDAVAALGLALETGNNWLQETAFRACRRLGQIDDSLARAIARYVEWQPLSRFWNVNNELIFSLSLSDALRRVHRSAVRKQRNLWISAVSIIAVGIIFPWLSSAYGTFLIVTYAFVTGVAQFSKSIQVVMPERSIWIVLIYNYNLLSASSFLVFIRLMLPIFLLASAISNGINHVDPLVVSTLTPNVGVSLLLLASLALLIVDWGVVDKIVLPLIGSLDSIDFRMESFHLAFITIVGTTSIFLLLAFFERLFVAAVLVIGIIAVAGLAVFLLRLIVAWTSDEKKIRRFAPSGRISRPEIVDMLTALRLGTSQTKLIRKLSAADVTVHGGWPASYHPRVGSDGALVDLARLDERWRGLDR